MAAFMSTYSSLLNWGSSYVVNDLYRRFLVRNASSRHYVVASQLVMLPMTLAAAVIALYSSSVLNLLFYVLLATTGAYTVHLARWLWWRVSAWSEIAGLVGSLICTFGVCIFFPHWVASDSMEQYYGHRMFFVMIGALIIWLVVTFLTRPVESEQLAEFFRRMRPPGFWGPVRRPLGLVSSVNVGQMFYSWGIMLMTIYGPLIGLPKLFFGEPVKGAVALGIGVVGLTLALHKARNFKEELPELSDVSG
jgi:hypothetical protein